MKTAMIPIRQPTTAAARVALRVVVAAAGPATAAAQVEAAVSPPSQSLLGLLVAVEAPLSLYRSPPVLANPRRKHYPPLHKVLRKGTAWASVPARALTCVLAVRGGKQGGARAPVAAEAVACRGRPLQHDSVIGFAKRPQGSSKYAW